MKNYKVNCTHCKKTSTGTLGDKNWVYGKGKDMGAANCHHCGARNKANITDEGVLGAINPNGVGVELRQALAKYNQGGMSRDALIKEVERLMWKAKTNDPQNYDLIKTTLARMISKNEGYGALDMSKDKKQAFKGARWTVKFNESVGDIGEGRTPSDKKSIRKLIEDLKVNTAIVFYSLENPKVGLYIRKTSNGSFDVYDTKGAEYQLHLPIDENKMDLLTSQLSVLYRTYNTHKTFSTIPSRMPTRPPEGVKGIKITKDELREVITELVHEMWVDPGTHPGEEDSQGTDGEEDGVKPSGRLTAAGADAPFVDLYKGDKKGVPGSLPSVGGAMSETTNEEYPGEKWNPKPFIKTKDEVADIIFQLKEGTGVTFMSEKQGRSADWVAVEKTVEGDEYVYKQFQYNDQGAKHYLETDEDVLDFATDIASNPKLTLYEFYEVMTLTGQPYRKTPRDLYEARGVTAKEKLRNIIKETIDEMSSND